MVPDVLDAPPADDTKKTKVKLAKAKTKLAVATTPVTTAIQGLLDRSGSMASIRVATENGWNSFLKEQRGVPGPCTVRLSQFDNAYEVVYESTPLADVPDITLHPRGTTALMDAWGRSMTEFDRKLAALPQRPDVVIFIVMTDGHENSSVEWTQEMINATVKTKTEQGWKFLYLGANQDAVKVGMEYGVQSANTVTYAATGRSVGSTYAVVSDVTQSWRTGDTTRGITDKDRKDAIGD